MAEAGLHHGEGEGLERRVAELEQLLWCANDAAFAMAGILSRILVEAGAIGREGLADIIETRAGAPDSPDHNALLSAFGRAVRANFPGGRFEVIEGGRSDALVG